MEKNHIKLPSQNRNIENSECFRIINSITTYNFFLLQTTGCNATAKGLKPGHLYQFEVSAINKEGQSEPILTGDPILAENPYSKNIFIALLNNIN